MTLALGTGRRKTPCNMVPTPNSRRIQPFKNIFRALTTNVCLKLALWTQCGALVSAGMIPGPTTHASGEENINSVRYFLPFAKLFATVRPGRRTRPLVVGSAQVCIANARTKKSRPRRGWAVNSGQRSQRFPFGVSGLYHGRVGQLNFVEFWRQLLASALTLRYQNTAPVSSAVL